MVNLDEPGTGEGSYYQKKEKIELVRISNFQLYCILIVFLTPLAFLQTPQILTALLQQNGWMAAVMTIIPGYMMIFVFNHILRKSQNPFPQLITEHLGTFLGKGIGFLYILFFVFLTSYTLRFFTDFIETNVLPGTPISIHIGVLILALVIGIKSGIGSLARLHEIIAIIGVPFAVIMVGIIVGQQGSVEKLLPLGHLDYQDFALAIGGTMFVVCKLFIILTFGFWCEDKSKAFSIMAKALWTYIIVIVFTTLAIIMTFGGIIPSVLIFPTFSMITLVNIGDFIQNIDIIFIGVWILGIYGVTVISWFMACYCTQVLLNLHDYKFLAAASSLVIGIVSILISANILELLVVTRILMPVIQGLFFIIIPLLILLAILLKSYPAGNPVLNKQNNQRGNTA